MTQPRKELLIWWTSDIESSDPSAPPGLPKYVQEQYALRHQYQGRAQLFVPEKFGAREISDWPDTFITRMIREGSSAGIVFASPDLKLFRDMPGVVTDFQLRMIVIT